MLIQTRGIVLRTTRFRESSAIVNIFTEQLGIQAYIINSIFSSRSKQKAAYLQPLSLLNLVVYNKPKQQIKRIKEMQWDQLYQRIPFDFTRRSIAVFINEILNKCIREESPNPALYQFLHIKLLHLDSDAISLTDYIAQFMLELAIVLGFAPMDNKSDLNPYFHLLQGRFVGDEMQIRMNDQTLNEQDSILFQRLIDANKNGEQKLGLKRAERQELVRILMRYYQCHVEQFGQLKSLPILEQLFDDFNKN